MLIGGTSSASWNVRNILCFQHFDFLTLAGGPFVEAIFVGCRRIGLWGLLGAFWGSVGAARATSWRLFGPPLETPRRLRAPSGASGRFLAPPSTHPGAYWRLDQCLLSPPAASWVFPGTIRLDLGLQPHPPLDSQIPGSDQLSWNRCFPINILLRIDDFRAWRPPRLDPRL